MSETPRKPELQPDDPTEQLAGEETSSGEETADQPTVNLKREQSAEPLLEDEPAEYELPDPAPSRAEPAGEAERPKGDGPGLPTSDPVFPTASPQLKPPAVPAQVEAPAPAGVARPLPPPGPPRQRSAAEIRADIEAGRQELSQSVEVLRDKVEELTDWRGQIRKHRREITIAAAAVGFVVGARFMMKRRRR